MSKFNGFEAPKENWSKLPHQLVDALPLIETIGEFKIIIYTLRHTWGYHDDYKKITLDEFQYGRKHKDGSRIDNGTGLTKPTIIDGIKRAIEHGFLFEHADTSDPARVKKFYSLKEEGLKVFTPDVKSFYPRGKESLHRTEKDTIETYSKKIMPNGKNGSLKTKKELTDQEKNELLIFGRHPDSDTPNGSFDTIQEIQNAGWSIRNHVIQQAIAYYLEAVREYHPGFAVPNNDGVRKDWYKAVEGHLQDYRVDDLKELYRDAIKLHNDKNWRFSRPGSLTGSLAEIAMETQTGDVVAWL